MTKRRVFACLVAQPSSETLHGLAVIAASRQEAVVAGTEAAAEKLPGGVVVGTLTQEDVTSLGMLLAAGRVALEAESNGGRS